MTATEIVTIFAAAGVLLTALGAVIVNIIVALKTTTAVRENAVMTAKISAKADVIEGHVNSAATKSTEKIEGLEKQIAALLTQLADTKITAALLAQSTATIAVVAPIAAAVELTTPPHPTSVEAPVMVTAPKG